MNTLDAIPEDESPSEANIPLRAVANSSGSDDNPHAENEVSSAKPEQENLSNQQGVIGAELERMTQRVHSVMSAAAVQTLTSMQTNAIEMLRALAPKEGTQLLSEVEYEMNEAFGLAMRAVQSGFVDEEPGVDG